MKQNYEVIANDLISLRELFSFFYNFKKFYSLKIIIHTSLKYIPLHYNYV